MSIKIDTLISEARSLGNTQDLEVLKLLKAELLNAKVSGTRKNHGDLSDQEEIAVIRSMIKSRQKSIEAYKAGSRQDLADNENREIEFLKTFLPLGPSDTELRGALTALKAQNPGLDFGSLMSSAKSMYPTVSPGELASILKSL